MTQTQKTHAPSQDEINASFFATLQRLEQRLETMQPASSAAEMEAFANVLATVVNGKQQPMPVSGPSGVLAATLGKNGKPLRIKREELLFGTHPHTNDIVQAAIHAEAVDSAYAYGIVGEPSEGLSPWAIAGIAVGAAALGAGVAIGVSYAMSADSE